MKYIIDHPSWQEACNGIACAFCTLKDRKNGECKIRNYIQNQPVYEERPYGEWITSNYTDELTCPICREALKRNYFNNFCSNCGAKLRDPNFEH